MTNDPTGKSGRLIAIGDIHGHALALRRLLELIVPQADDVLVTLGDYVNRGPDSCGVLETLLELRQRCNSISILGNHDEMMLESRTDRHAERRWRSQGGTESLKSYGNNDSTGDVPESHWEFLEACRPSYETDDWIFTHANYCWYAPLDQQPVSLLRWISIVEEPPRRHLSGKIVILGHTPGLIRDAGAYRCLDTGCGFGGNLTALDLTTNHVWQATEEGTPV